jgi:hypothetical protein
MHHSERHANPATARATSPIAMNNNEGEASRQNTRSEFFYFNERKLKRSEA